MHRALVPCITNPLPFQAHAATARRRHLAVHKDHKEFYTPDPGKGWETPAGYPRGIEQQILAGSLDEKAKRGHRTRHLRFAPGVYTTEPFVHDYWEEVYLIS